MQQPELGKQISKARQIKKITQAELAIECEVDIRTIQRIENGNVTPRIFTLRIINEKLDTDFDLNGDKLVPESKKMIMAYRLGWISGIVLFCLLPIMVLEYSIFETSNLSVFNKVLLRVLYVSLHILSVSYFYRALFILGQKMKNIMLPIAAIVTIVFVLLSYFLKMFEVHLEFTNNPYVLTVLSRMFAIPSILVGIGFVTIKKFKKELAVAAGIIQILAGFSYAVVGVFGIFAGGIALALEVYYLFVYEKSIS